MLQAVLNAFKIADLRRKIIFTLAMLVVFRFVAHVPVPGVDFDALRRAFETPSDVSNVFNILNIFSGGTLQNFSVAAMGVYPYITASIIIQLLTGVIPRLTELSKEGEQGRNQLNRYTHWLTVPLAALQAFGQAQLLHTQFGALPEFGLVGPYWLTSWTILISLIAGTMFLVWLGELITEHGIGQGISIIIFAGILARLPTQMVQLFQGGTGPGIFSVFLFGVIGLITIVGIVLINEGQRRIPVQISKQIRGNRVVGGGSTHIPLKVNSAGMIPLIFASSMLILPWTISSYFVNSDFTIFGITTVGNIATKIYETFNAASSPFYWTLYFIMVVAFTFFYALVIFQQQNIAENLQRQNGFIPGIRPGRPTHQYLSAVLIRITVAGALFLGIVAVLPFFVKTITGFQTLTIQSTAMLIVVGVALDTMRQLEAQLIMRNYRGFIGR